MPDSPAGSQAQPISGALCVDSEAFDRLGRILRHLVVGLVDQAISLRILSEDPRIKTLTLGPVQTVQHLPVVWPVRRGRINQILDVLAHQPPGVVHAASAGCYATAWELAEALETELVCQVSSIPDCEALAQLDLDSVGRFLVMTDPLRNILLNQLKIAPQRIMLVRPGVPVSEEAVCFGRPELSPTILCTSAFEKHAGVDRLIVALDLVRKQIPVPATFLLGQGKSEATLRKMIRDRGLSGEVTFAQPLGNPATLIHNADMFVRPCVDEGVCGDLLQAMGAGSLVITFPSSVLDYLQHEQTAHICESTAQSLAAAIVRAVRQPQQARALAQTGMDYVREHHGVSAMAEITAETYRDLVLSNATFPLQR